MKIIHLVLGKANPERMNGVNKVVHQLANAQHSLGYDVSVWGIANDLEHNYPFRDFPTILFQQYKSKKISPQLKTAIQYLSGEVLIHIHGAFIPEFIQIARLLKKQHIPYIFTPHGSFAKAAMEKNKWVKKVYFHLLEKQLIKDAKAIQLLGINEYTNLEKLVQVPHKILIPNGIAISDIPTYFEEQKAEGFIFGFCGRLDIYHKGLDLMLKGFQLYLKNGGNASLELIGDGKDRPKLEQLAIDLGIAERVIFHGALFGTKKFQTIHRFDTFLHTSRMEGFPMAVLEAAALSIPCITSEATNINNYIREYDAGITLSDNTPSHIAKAMEQSLSHFTTTRLQLQGKNARRMVETAFDWKHIAQQLIQTYAA